MGCGGSKEMTCKQLDRPFLSSWGWVMDPHLSRMPPVKPDHFTPVTPLGKGKFGMVFLCQHRGNTANSNATAAASNPKYVAVKYIPKAIIFDCRCVERIQHELDVIHTLNHPFILYCFGSFDSTASIGIVLEAAMGGELYTRIRRLHTDANERNGYTIESIARFYIGEIALALHYLHDVMHIVYRDLKPENVLIDTSGHVKLCDFGFAVRMSTTGVQGLSSPALGAGVVGAAASPGDAAYQNPSGTRLGRSSSVSSSAGLTGDGSSAPTPRASDGGGGTTNGSHSSAHVAPYTPLPPEHGTSSNAALYDGCGTAMYVAPEIAGGFMKQAHSYPVDWWALGVILYELVIGVAPYGDTDTMSKFEIFNNVLRNKVRYPLSPLASMNGGCGHASPKCRELISGLLTSEPDKRSKYNSFRSSGFMKEVNFDTLFDRRVHPPWVPAVEQAPHSGGAGGGGMDSASSAAGGGGWGANGTGSSLAHGAGAMDRKSIARNFIEWGKKVETPDSMVAPSFEASSYCKALSFPRPLTVAIKGTPPPAALANSPRDARGSGGSPALNRGSSNRGSFTGTGGAGGSSPAGIGTRGKSKSISGSSSGGLMLYNNKNSSSPPPTSRSAVSSPVGATSDSYEYDPGSAGVVSKRAWQEDTDVDSKAKVGRNGRLMRGGKGDEEAQSTGRPSGRQHQSPAKSAGGSASSTGSTRRNSLNGGSGGGAVGVLQRQHSESMQQQQQHALSQGQSFAGKKKSLYGV